MVAEPGSRLNRAPAVIPVILLNLLVWIACASEVMSAPLIDTRLLGKPPRFEGDINAWKQWRFQTLAYFGALDPDLHEDLKLAESIPAPIAYGDLNATKQGRSRMVFYVLSQLLNKAPLQVLMGISDNNGYEAWRSLKRDYEPDSGSRHVAMLSNVLRPTFEGTLPEFWEKLRRWHNDVETYEASSGEELTDNM